MKKTIIVTGASTGIGKAIVQLFLENNYNVIINSLNGENLHKTYEVFGSPQNVIPIVGDIALKSVGESLVNTAVEKFGALDVLVNNAGIFQPQPFLEVTDEDLNRFLDTNLKGTFFTTQFAIRQMLKQSGGSIINIGTVLVDHALTGMNGTAPVVSKGAIHALTRQLAAEFGTNNIRVNTIAPGVIRSPLQAKTGLDNADSLASLHLLNRIGEPREIAEAAYYLSTAEFVTGETINVAGGHTIGH